MSKAYIQKEFFVSESQWHFFNAHTSSLNIHTRRFLCHLLKSTITQIRQYRIWIPISATLIKNHLWDADLKLLQERGFIEFKQHNRQFNRSREYRINKNFLCNYIKQNSLNRLNYKAIEVYQKEKKINLFDGSCRQASLKSILYDKSRHTEPKAIIESVRSIRYCLFNREAILNHLKELQGGYQNSEGIDGVNKEHHLFNYILDLYCFESILNQKPKQTIDKHIYKYVPAYKVQSTGRIQERGGGLQNCSKKMKIAAFNGIKNLEMFDITASHANIILSLMEDAGIRCLWLEDYLNLPDKKYEYAEKIGIRYSTWKRCLYALLMGASIREHAHNPENTMGKYLSLDINDPKLLESAYQSFLSLTNSLRLPLAKWYEYLMMEFVPTKTKKVGKKSYLKNAVGKTKLITNSTNKRQVAAFLIQGYETAFIHKLTTLSNKYLFDVISNEHDALYVIGHISQQAIKEAKAFTKLKYLKITRKTI